MSNAVELLAPSGDSMQVRIRTQLGKMVLRRFGSDAEFWDDRQCVLERASGGQWTVKPSGPTTNQTLINGRALIGPQQLRAGDQISVGNESKKVAKLPLIVRFA
jgi:hypothetical protein